MGIYATKSLTFMTNSIQSDGNALFDIIEYPIDTTRYYLMESTMLKKKALCIYAITALISLGTFAYAEITEDTPFEQTDHSMAFEETQPDESFVDPDEEEQGAFACGCKEIKDEEENMLAFSSEEEETTPSLAIDEEPESSET